MDETVKKAAEIYMLTGYLPRINTIRDDQMEELAEFFGVNYRKDFLCLSYVNAVFLVYPLKYIPEKIVCVTKLNDIG